MTVYRTPTSERASIAIYKKSAHKFGKKTALETMRQIKAVLSKLDKNPYLGKLDPEHHSNQFRYVQTKNRQKIFYEIVGKDVFIVMIDYDARDWKKLLDKMAPRIKREINSLQKRIVIEFKDQISSG